MPAAYLMRPLLFCVALVSAGAAYPAGESPDAQRQARVLYILHCGGCHRPDGTGAPPEVPPLGRDLAEIVQVPEGRSYIARVPGAASAPVNDAELTQILNWILTAFTRSSLPEDYPLLEVSEVTEARQQILSDPISYRERIWGAYPAH